jgi:hypothetical protein
MSNSVAYQGRGSMLQVGVLTSPPGFTTVAQLRKFAFGGAKTTLADITNLDSPTAYMERIATVIDPGDVTFDGVLNPSDDTYLSLNDLQANRTLSQFLITLTDGTTYDFDGYVTEFVPASVDYSKEIVFSGKITITGAVTITAV